MCFPIASLFRTHAGTKNSRETNSIFYNFAGVDVADVPTGLTSKPEINETTDAGNNSAAGLSGLTSSDLGTSAGFHGADCLR